MIFCLPCNWGLRCARWRWAGSASRWLPMCFSAGCNCCRTIPSYAQLYAHLAAVALSFAAITYFQVVVGELVPKSLALRRAEALAVAVAPPMLLFMALARPAVRFLRNSAALLLRGFDVPMTERAAVHSPEELKLIATAARRMGVLPQVPGDDGAPRAGAGRCDDPRDYDAAAEDFFPAFGHAGRGGKRQGD